MLATIPEIKTCPKCGFTGNTLVFFGTRVMRGVEKPQSWCRECRKHERKGKSPKAAPAPALEKQKRSKVEQEKHMSTAQSQLQIQIPETPAKDRPPQQDLFYELTTDKYETEKLFDKFFPTDPFHGNRRAWYFMARELRALLGDQLNINKKAVAAFNKIEK